jgi:hypothetical protein
MKTSLTALFIFSLAMTGCSVDVTAVDVLKGFKSRDVVMRARVVEVGESCGGWSGIFVFGQDVKYDVLEVYKGPQNLSGKQVIVSHVLVGGGPTEDTTPRLKPWLFRPSTEVVLFLSSDEGFQSESADYFVCGGESVGVMFLRDGRLVWQ